MFLNGDLQSTINYSGPIPPYNCFESKHTTSTDYDDMLHEFANKPWSFLEVSRNYILGDVMSLYQILLSFFEAIVSKFPIDPLSVLSAQSTALKPGEPFNYLNSTMRT